MNIEIQVTGLEEAIEKISRYADSDRINQALDKAIVPVLVESVTRMQTGAPSRSGGYRRTIGFHKVSDTGYALGSPSKLAGILEGGSKAHDIYPRYKKALKWRGNLSFGAQLAGITGRVGVQHVARTNFVRSSGAKSLTWYTQKSSKTQNDVFARHVHHPGTAPQPHLEPVIKDFTTPTLQSELIQALYNVAQGGI